MGQTDHRKALRHRCEEFNRAIFAAALDELAERGCQRLPMELIAQRTRTRKASLYRAGPAASTWCWRR
ncbi:MAG TPA: TetR family transcriptional regulator [Pseudonocardiaceae bacterium]